jgi:hypothetical protein
LVDVYVSERTFVEILRIYRPEILLEGKEFVLTTIEGINIILVKKKPAKLFKHALPAQKIGYTSISSWGDGKD